MSEWSAQHTGKIWQVLQQEQSNGKLYEIAVRTPGVRLLAVKDDRILLNKEKRHELDGAPDIRLPGGKVYDKIQDFMIARSNPEAVALQGLIAAVAEAKEEVGLIINQDDLDLIKKDINGGKGEWDLFYYLTRVFDIDPNGPSYHDSEAEEIEGWDWYTKEEAKLLALDPINGMSESRSARYVLAWAEGLFD